MLVYRCITQMEILNKFKEINDEVISYKGANTHKYEKDISYIHFFRYKKSAELCSSADFFIMLSVDPLDLEVLDLVGGLVVTDKDGDKEHFASCIEGSEGIFHVGTTGLVGDFKRSRRV